MAWAILSKPFFLKALIAIFLKTDKFSGELQIPDSSVKLDYSTLLTEAKDEKMKLYSELELRLERLRPDKLLERKGNEAENLNKALKYRPMPSPYVII